MEIELVGLQTRNAIKDSNPNIELEDINVDGITRKALKGMGPKYTLLETEESEDGVKLYQLLSTQEFANVKEGELGGYIDLDSSLSQEDRSWVHYGARIINSKLEDDTVIEGPTSRVVNSTLTRVILGQLDCYVNNSTIKDSIVSHSDLIGELFIEESTIIGSVIEHSYTSLGNIRKCVLERADIKTTYLDIALCQLTDSKITNEVSIDYIISGKNHFDDCVFEYSVGTEIKINETGVVFSKIKLDEYIQQRINLAENSSILNKKSSYCLNMIGEILNGK